MKDYTEWEFEKEDYDNFGIYLKDSEECIAVVWNSEYNARLIAAAPDLLTACKNAILLIIGERIKNDNLKPDSIIEEHLEVLLCKSENELKEAIKKAEGK